MKYILLIIIFIAVFPIVLSQDCNTLCLNSGYTSGKCAEKCTEIKIGNADDCKLSGTASLIIGSDSSNVYKDLDKFINENKSDPKWTWVIKNMKTTGSTKITNANDDSKHSGPIIGLKNSFIANDIDSLGVKALGTGSSFCFPNNVICVKFKSLKPTNYATFKIEKTTVDLSTFNSTWTSKEAILLYSEDDTNGLKIDTSAYTIATAASGTKTNTIWIVFNSTTYAGIFYKDANSNAKKVAGYADMSSSTTDINIADTNYKETKDNRIQIDLRGDFGTADNLDLVLDILGSEGLASTNTADDLTINLKHSANSDIKGFGNSSAVADAADQVWNATNIGTKDIDLRTLYGLIIKNPKTNNALDKLILEVPEDQVKALVEITKKPSSFTKTSLSQALTMGQRIPSSLFEDELKFKEDYNLILIGGPCANKIVEEFEEFPKCENWPFKNGESIIKYAKNGRNTALLVAGTNEEDTNTAVNFLSNYENYKLEGTYIKIEKNNPIIITQSTADIDFSDYPYPFIENGNVKNMLIVVGKKASFSDITSSQDLVTSLLWITRIHSNATNITENINSSTIIEEIPLGDKITGNTFFSASLTNSNLPSLIKSKLNFAGKSYSYHEEILLYNNGPSMETSLSSLDDNYKSDVYMEATSGSLRYYYVFDTDIDLTKATTSDPLSVNILDNLLSITKIDSDTQIKSQSGLRYLINIGDEVKVNNIKVKLLNVNKNRGIIVNVNNTNEIIDEDQTKFVSGLEIVNSEAFKQSSDICCCSNLLNYL